VYSHANEPPYDPSLIRLPGYPLFLAAVYSVCHHDNNTAVRMVQAVLDTASSGMIGLIAFWWEPDDERKYVASLAALSLAVLCPFSAIYVVTILTETPATFLAVGTCLIATLAFREGSFWRGSMLWALCGIIAGVGVLFRPDSGLFAAAVGLTLVLTTLLNRSDHQAKNKRAREILHRFPKLAYYVAVFSIAFCLVLVPWTIRNERVFHVFQPLAPAHAEMPGEFVPRGYLAWLRTWLDDDRYIEPVLWSLDERRIKLEDFPAQAFDSPEEKATVGALLEKYNHPPDSEDEASDTEDEKSGADSNKGDNEPDQKNSNDVVESDEGASSDQTASTEEQGVEMTSDIDAGFAQLSQARIARAPFRYYLRLPLTRAKNLWFDTHSEYYPFEGELLPLADLDHDLRQQFWLPLFMGITWLYTLLAILGGRILWRSRQFAAKRWLLLAVLMILLRLAFFSTLENPEPRYVVEIFPFLAILSGIALARGSVLRQLKFWAARA
jgi:hypothetical protein